MAFPLPGTNFLPMRLIFACLVLITLLHVRTLPAVASAASTIGGNETDLLALLAIKSKIMHDPRGVLSSWNDSLHFCEWQGVKCGQRHRRVTIINLGSKGLVGTLSPSTGNLSFLQGLNLYNNSFQGEIPIELGNLFRLQELNLNNNDFKGNIPASIARCSNLTHLGVAYNKLVGKFPEELTSLSKLSTLAIHVNNLTGGITPFIGNLTSLESFSAAENPFGGSIPDTLGQLRNLRRLGLGRIQLSGMLPPSVYNLSNLNIFSVAHNELRGSLPPSFGFMFPHLQFLQLQENQFTGPLPLSVSNLSEVVKLELGRNNFNGKIRNDFGSLENIEQLTLYYNNFGSGDPDELDFLGSLTNCSKLEVLGIEVNQFKGVLPDSVGNLSNHLFFFTLGGNQLSGAIPSTIGNLVNVAVLGMDSNQFTGPIPTSIGILQKLQRLAFEMNKLSGKIPDSIGNLLLLNELYLGYNRLEGTIPSSLGNCKSLLLLKVSDNNLGGPIPGQLFTISSLSISLNLARNQFVGSLPTEVGNLKNLVELDLSGNELSGEIPGTLGSCTSLQNLSLQDNFFQGSIPLTLESLRGIQNFDLSHNNLSGKVPAFLGNFNLKKLSLSFNNFEGELPVKGVFLNASAVSVAGNSRLCGGVSELNLPNCTTEKSKTKMPLSHVLAITAASVLVGAIIITFSIIFWFRKKRKTQSTVSLLKESFLKVSYEDLLKATDGFSSVNLIGLGSFGSVYRGILNQDQEVVAIKVLNLQNCRAIKSFKAECETLRSIRHRNLIRIITSCSSIDFHGNDFKALVYEFMPNGSLEDWLHPSTKNTSNGQNELQKLNLLQKIKIAIDVASALNYLHHQCEMPIIHCDLKPSNILLDNDMVAHVGDFGLARFYQDRPNQSSSLGVRGTIGYAAPEYGLGSDISANGDVYSYGILLLEMMTGKRPTDSMFKEGLNLHSFAAMALPDCVKQIVDPMLLTNEYEEEAGEAWEPVQVKNGSRMVECVTSMVRIGVACSEDSPQGRMSTSNVLHELHLIKDKLLLLTGRSDG